MRFIICCFLVVYTGCFAAYARQDSIPVQDSSVLHPVDPNSVHPFLPDSAVKANRDAFVTDSIAMFYLRPDSARTNQFISNLHRSVLFDIFSASFDPVNQNAKLRIGQLRNSRGAWIIVTVISLLIYTALLNLFLGADIKSVIRSFYNNNALSQMDKEGGLINSWAFIGLFLLFSLALGLVLYQLTIYYNVVYRISGFQLYITFSAGVGLLLALKFTVLKGIGFIFDIRDIVSQYLAVLNLTYFNMAFVFLFVAMCFSLLPVQLIPVLLNFTIGITILVFAWQYLRNSVNIISDFRFHKFYLFIYLCALEICPVLILIKALDI